MSSTMFLVLLNDVIGVFVSDFLIASYICKIGKYFYMILYAFGAVRLFDITNGIQISC